MGNLFVFKKEQVIKYQVFMFLFLIVSYSFAEHSELICDVSWNKSSSHYITGSYDHTVRVVDVEKSAGVSIQRLDGFVQCCVYSPDETEVYFAGTSQKMIYCLDTRTTTTT